MILEELSKCAIKYYNLHTELNTDTRINNINTIFGISRTSFYRFLKNSNDNCKKKTTI